MERFRQIGITTAIENSLPVSGHGKSRYRDDRDRLCPVVGFELPGYIYAGETWQHDVQKNQVRAMRPRHINPSFGKPGYECRVSMEMEHVPYELLVQRIVFDDKYAPTGNFIGWH
jgi:hypothetical protein